jgi:hypothetical protein
MVFIPRMHRVMKSVGVVMNIRTRGRLDSSRTAPPLRQRVFVEMFLHGGLRCDVQIESMTGEVEQKQASQQASKQVIPLPNGRQRKQTGSSFLFQVRV